MGNPLGELGGTVTGGMISALNRSVTIQGSSSVNTMSLIQMDASVSPGNSGGGLFNMNGELVGIVNAKSSSSDAFRSATRKNASARYWTRFGQATV